MSEAVKYLELAVECFLAAQENVIAAKTSEEVVRLTLTEDFTDCDLIEKVPTSLTTTQARSVFVVLGETHCQPLHDWGRC